MGLEKDLFITGSNPRGITPNIYPSTEQGRTSCLRCTLRIWPGMHFDKQTIFL